MTKFKVELAALNLSLRIIVLPTYKSIHLNKIELHSSIDPALLSAWSAMVYQLESRPFLTRQQLEAGLLLYPPCIIPKQRGAEGYWAIGGLRSLQVAKVSLPDSVKVKMLVHKPVSKLMEKLPFISFADLYFATLIHGFDDHLCKKDAAAMDLSGVPCISSGTVKKIPLGKIGVVGINGTESEIIDHYRQNLIISPAALALINYSFLPHVIYCPMAKKYTCFSGTRLLLLAKKILPSDYLFRVVVRREGIAHKEQELTVFSYWFTSQLFSLGKFVWRQDIERLWQLAHQQSLNEKWCNSIKTKSGLAQVLKRHRNGLFNSGKHPRSMLKSAYGRQ